MRQYVRVAVPGRVEKVEVSEPALGDIAVRLILDTGESLAVSLRDIGDPKPPAVDAVDLYSFLLLQSVSPALIQAAMDNFDGAWEQMVEERKRRNDEQSGFVRRPPLPAFSSGQGSPGVCDICGRPVEANSSFVNIGPTDWTDPSKPKAQQWVSSGTDIHGWTPFVVEHPTCFAKINGEDALTRLQGT